MSDNVHPVFDDVLKPFRPRKPLLMADINVIRAAIFDVADDGHKCNASVCDIKHSWFFDQNESDEQTEHRAKFADAVERRIRWLQDVLNQGVKLQNYCERHRAARLPESVADYCPDCEAEARAKLGDAG